uniref:Uncharacterized protein n=1 Tax=Nelumbo nucifera TaxID=4432 RepID=A0A822XPS9_NELNU|nr:TPA_asm: hypothetical protein HUJ06_023903 [Nelumbo nucifera]
MPVNAAVLGPAEENEKNGNEDRRTLVFLSFCVDGQSLNNVTIYSPQ